jgi:hypothetical protein
MAIGIWTPVEGSTLFKSFPLPDPKDLNSKKAAFAPVAGTHMMIVPMGCYPVFVSVLEPMTDAVGFTGTPVYPNVPFVLPRLPAVWIYNPYESQVVHCSVGAMT